MDAFHLENVTESHGSVQLCWINVSIFYAEAEGDLRSKGHRHRKTIMLAIFYSLLLEVGIKVVTGGKGACFHQSLPKITFHFSSFQTH